VTVFDPERILLLLDNHRVAYVLIGGLASNLHGYDRITTDLEVCYERGRENVERLVAMLHELEAGRASGPKACPSSWMRRPS
jgi:hypothetical protein